MSDILTLDKPKRGRFAHVAYRWRWLFLVLWCVLALLWWAVYVEPLIWGWRGGPVRGFIGFLSFYWTQTEYRFDRYLPRGLDELPGFYDFHALLQPAGWRYFQIEALIAWIDGVVILFGVLVGIYASASLLGLLSRSQKQALPARKELTQMQIVFVALASGALLACLASLVIGFLSPMIWSAFIYLEWPNPSNSGFSNYPTIWPFIALALVLAVPAYFAWQKLFVRIQRFWKIEFITSVLSFSSFVILAWSYWAAHEWVYHEDAVLQPMFYSASIFLWAFGLRVWLLFRLKRFERDALKHREEPECFACGYNLRGTILAQGKTCPECGAPILKEQVAMMPVEEPPEAVANE